MNEISVWVLLLCSPLAILATWAPVFVIASGTANAYVMYSTLARPGAGPEQFRRLLFRGLLNGVMLYLFSMFSMTFLHLPMEFNGKFHYSLLTGYLTTGQLPDFSLDFLFFNDALAMLGVTGIFTTLLLCALWRGEGVRRVRRTYWVLGGTAALIIVLSPWLHGQLDDAFYRCLNEHRWGKALLLKCLIGPRFSPIPLAAYSLFGAVFGTGLANGADLRWFRRYGYGAGLGFLALFAGTAMFQGFHFIELTMNAIPMKIHFLDMGLILIAATMLLEISEFRDPVRQERFARRTRILQRFGRVSLSIFLSETLVAVLFMKPYLALWGVSVFPRQPQVTLPFLAFLVLFWAGVARIWERYEYKYGVEWFLVWLNGKLIGYKSLRLTKSPE